MHQKNIVIIMRGVSGVGKSTAARSIHKHLPFLPQLPVEICSADNYFLNRGVYKFNRNQLTDAHEWCQDVYLRTQRYGNETKIVIIDNTNIAFDDYEFYLTDAQSRDQMVIIVTVLPGSGDYKKRDLHDVPEETWRRQIRRMGDHKVPMSALQICISSS